MGTGGGDIGIGIGLVTMTIGHGGRLTGSMSPPSQSLYVLLCSSLYTALLGEKLMGSYGIDRI
jgi:hypothetical protein